MTIAENLIAQTTFLQIIFLIVMVSILAAFWEIFALNFTKTSLNLELSLTFVSGVVVIAMISFFLVYLYVYNK